MLSSTEVLNMEKAPQVLCCTCVSFWLTFETVSHITFCPLHTFPATCPGARHGVTDEYKQWSVLLSVQFNSVAQSCPTLWDPINCSTPGLPVHHQLLEFTQTHVHQVGDAIQPSLPLSSPSPPAHNPSQHQGLFQWVNSAHEVAKVLEFLLQ